MERIGLYAALASLVLAIITSLIVATNRGKESSKAGTRRGGDRIGTTLAVIGVGCITVSIISRALLTGHGPFSNMYEFAIAFSWGIVVAGLAFQWRYSTSAVKNIGIIIAILLLLFATRLSVKYGGLVPALQQSFLLSVHVAAAIVAYGTLTIGFAAAVLFLIQSRKSLPGLPEPKVLDNMSHAAVVIGFPFLTLTIVLGALWADIAWGRYWGWEPKETASLVTWLVYAAYLHARVMRHWRGTRSAVLVILGFVAIVLTFFGNYIFSGLHSYQ
ncbi:MAG: c-type cytochrome biogenesis protein CcsB [Chloroflexota bacterium]